jgi:tyrosyl-tRNA synthetase
LEEFNFENGTKIMEILKETNLVKSNGEARRKIDEGAVQIDGEKISDYFTEISQGEKILKLGKKMVKINLR